MLEHFFGPPYCRIHVQSKDEGTSRERIFLDGKDYQIGIVTTIATANKTVFYVIKDRLAKLCYPPVICMLPKCLCILSTTTN